MNRIESLSPRGDALPLVSVVIAAYNAERTLAAAIESVLRQTYLCLEIIVIDDGSKDGTANIIRSFGEQIRTAWQPNGGLASARNSGCKLARGELIALMDADDLCAPERIAVQVRVFRRFPDAILCGSNFSAFGEGGEISPSFGAEYYSEIADTVVGLAAKYEVREMLPEDEIYSQKKGGGHFIEVFKGVVYQTLAFGNFVHPPTVMVRRGALFEVGLFDTSIRYNSDWECFVRLSRLGPFVHVERSLLAYRLSPVQMSSSVGNMGRGASDLVRTFEKILLGDGELVRGQPDRIRDYRRRFRTDAARALLESDRSAAAKLLCQAASVGGIDREWLMTLFKLFLPKSALEFFRRLKKPTGSA